MHERTCDIRMPMRANGTGRSRTTRQDEWAAATNRCRAYSSSRLPGVGADESLLQTVVLREEPGIFE